jgi:hypothetical protein
MFGQGQRAGPAHGAAAANVSRLMQFGQQGFTRHADHGDLAQLLRGDRHESSLHPPARWPWG